MNNTFYAPNDWWAITHSELYHHGIKGQHWGERNGPPYPLDKAAHKAVVNGASDETKKQAKKIAGGSHFGKRGAYEKAIEDIHENQRREQEARQNDLKEKTIKANSEINKRLKQYESGNTKPDLIDLDDAFGLAQTMKDEYGIESPWSKLSDNVDKLFSAWDRETNKAKKDQLREQLSLARKKRDYETYFKYIEAYASKNPKDSINMWSDASSTFDGYMHDNPNIIVVDRKTNKFNNVHYGGDREYQSIIRQIRGEEPRSTVNPNKYYYFEWGEDALDRYRR